MVSTVENTSEWKQPINICRCCLADGCYKDISTEYFSSGQKEVYEDMLKQTFNIQISYQKAGGPSLGSRLICEECIVRLRDAFAFKQVVVQSENRFTEYLDQFQSAPDVLLENNSPDPSRTESVKVEILQITEIDYGMKSDEQNGDVFNNDCGFDEDDEILANIKLELRKVNEIPEVQSNKVTPRRKNSQENSSKKISKIKNDECKKGKIKRNTKADKDWLKIVERRGTGPLLRDNSLKLLANSTICVFQWHKSRYRCFCCKEPFSNMTLLRAHTEKEHRLEHIEKRIIIQQNQLVKVEVSILHCKICSEELESLTALRNHLRQHDIQFELDEDLLVPFKIDNGNLQCQICSESFTLFRLLNIHMNKHYQKQVCHVCGAGFSSLVFLNLHKIRLHRPLSCKQCDLIFTNKVDKKQHDTAVHGVKFERKLRFPCPHCQERFFEEYSRVLHLVDKHNMAKPEYKCTMCSKVFVTKSLCNNHVKNVHMKEKNHECDICHHLFYTKSDVTRHRVSHTGEKRFSCTLCSNLFATKDSLRRHMKRTHVGMH